VWRVDKERIARLKEKREAGERPFVKTEGQPDVAPPKPARN
jgi:hypothetical protein